MAVDVRLTPHGRLLVTLASSDDSAADPWLKRVLAGFSKCQAAGLFALASHRPELPPPIDLAFWRDFACRYLTALCRTSPEDDEVLPSIPPPADEELAALVSAAPPMTGGEYLNETVLRSLWQELDAWVRDQVAGASSLHAWLKQHAPVWHRVGRVCFHLAERRDSEDFPFAFLATYTTRLSKAGRVQHQPLSRALKECAGNRRALLNLLMPVQRAAERVPFVKELVDSGDIFHPLAWTPQEAFRFLKSVPELEECGILVRVPDWWSQRPRVRVNVTVGEQRQARLGADALLDFDVRVAVGDRTLSNKELRQILKGGEGLVYVRGQWVEVDPEKLRQTLDHWRQVQESAGRTGLSFVEAMRLLAGAPADLHADGALDRELREWSTVRAGNWLSRVLKELRQPDGSIRFELNGSFRGTLRPYQEVGCRWLWLLANLGLGGCLADDMGLGKTVQVLALLQALKEQKPSPKPSLLVVPASLLANWKAEIARFTPELQTCFVHPSELDRRALSALARSPSRKLKGVDLVITTYTMLLRQQWLQEVDWRLVILDEAQAIKNPSARQTRAVKRLTAEARFALTGTPLENRLTDLWSLFDFLCPGLLGSARQFKEFVRALQAREQERYAPLRNLVRPYILRRLKTDKSVISDLPEKTEMKVYCGLTRKQASLYAQTVKELARRLQDTSGIERRGTVLAYLMRFKQICNHPSQLCGDGAYEPGDSGKFERLGAICEEIASRQEKALIFTQFREMTEPLAAFLEEIFGRPGLVLHGGTPVKRRRKLIEAFQDDDGPPFFVLSLKAGGTGLNLTAATHVIHFDRWWNPAVENQATDRAFRIGQRRNVLVHKFVCRGTVEEKIDALIDEKSQLAEDILQGGAEVLLTEMTDEELLQTVALDITRAVM